MPCRSARAMSSYRCSLKAEGCEGQQTPKGEQGAHGSSVAMHRGLASPNEIRLSTSIKAQAGTCDETIVIPKIKSVTALTLRCDERTRRGLSGVARNVFGP